MAENVQKLTKVMSKDPSKYMKMFKNNVFQEIFTCGNSEKRSGNTTFLLATRAEEAGMAAPEAF